MSYERLKRRLLDEKKVWVDPDFPPSNASLYFNGVPNADSPTNITWKRPTAITNTPEFITGKCSRFDFDQGALGDCWFIAAAAVLATSHTKQFSRVVPHDQSFRSEYCGLFRFNFWWYGKWVEVLIDDNLPCSEWGALLYCSNREEPNEFWTALLEKAYAKLNGCYQALDGGKLQDALVDFTGGISEVIYMQDKSKAPPDLFSVMLKTTKMNSMLGASIHRPKGATSAEVEKSNGLYMGHAYSITGLAEIPYRGRSVNLIRLRNPWGAGEWKGAWSDWSREIINLSEKDKKSLNLVQRKDGEFWMPEYEFIQNFDEVQICHLQPDSMTEEVAIDLQKKQWLVHVYHDAWIRGITAGGCGNSPNERLFWMNPQFHIHLKDVDDDGQCTLIVSLMEKEFGADKSIAIEFDIFKLKDNYPEPLDGEKVSKKAVKVVMRGGRYQFYRELTRRIQFSPGHYILIPSTFNVGQESEFILRMFTEKAVDSSVIDVTTGPVKPEHVHKKDIIDELFMKHSGPDYQVDAEELMVIVNEAFHNGTAVRAQFSLEACRSLHVMMDLNRSGFLSKNEVRDMWNQMKAYQDVFLHFDKDKSGNVDTFELGAMFKSLGFPVSRQVLISIVRRYGGRNSRINLEDFIIAVCKLTTMFHIFSNVKSRKSHPADGDVSFSMNEFLQHTMFC